MWVNFKVDAKSHEPIDSKINGSIMGKNIGLLTEWFIKQFTHSYFDH